MNSSHLKLLQYFIKLNFPKGNKVIDGIRYTVELSSENSLVNIFMENVSDVSTTRNNMIGTIDDLIYDFSRLLPNDGTPGPSQYHNLKHYFKYYSELSKHDVYLNSSDESKLLGIYNTIKNVDLRYRTYDDEIIDVNFSVYFDSVAVYDSEIIVSDNVKINSYYVDGELTKKSTRFFDLLESEDNFYDYFRGQGKFGEIIDFFWGSKRLIDPDSDMFVNFNHNWKV